MPSTEAKTMQVQVRWMIRRDMPEVLNIESGCYENPWSEEDFLTCLRQHHCIGMVAEQNEQIVGFMIYELLKHQLHVLNFAVAPHMQRSGVGSVMVEKLIHKLQQQKRYTIVLACREKNLAAQKFFSRMGFKATNILRDYYEDTTEDAYCFKYELKTAAELANPYRAGNRISEFLD